MDKIYNRLEELKREYAPDSRVAIFEYSFDEYSKTLTVKTDLNDAAKKISMIRSSFSGFELKLDFLPSEELGGNAFGVINLSVANLRSEPKHSAELASQALLGTPVKLLEKRGEWYRIQTPDKYISWTDDDSFERMDFLQLDKWQTAKKIIFIKEFGFVFEKPDIASNHVSDLVIGDILILLKDEGGFCEIQYPDGRTGYIPNENCADFSKWFSNPRTNGVEILNTAFKFIGLPYLWGGTSFKGVDCSGFTKTVYYLNGIMLPRDASQQVNTGELVDTKNGFGNLKPGDLLFFGTKAGGNKKEKVTHVGIYIGNMEFIHSSGKVKINSLDPNAENFNEYRYKTFIRAKRILSSLNKNGIESVSENQFYSE